jgi:hypothetical protein
MLTDEDLENLRHMVGFASHIRRRDWGYRNRFAAGGDQVESMERLQAEGLVVTGSVIPGGLQYYHATEDGMVVAGMPDDAVRRCLAG